MQITMDLTAAAIAPIELTPAERARERAMLGVGHSPAYIARVIQAARDEDALIAAGGIAAVMPLAKRQAIAINRRDLGLEQDGGAGEEFGVDGDLDAEDGLLPLRAPAGFSAADWRALDDLALDDSADAEVGYAIDAN